MPQEKLRLVLAAFLVFIGARSAYRASVEAGIHLPGWALSAILLTILAVTRLFVRHWNRLWPQAAATAAFAPTPRFFSLGALFWPLPGADEPSR